MKVRMEGMGEKEMKKNKNFKTMTGMKWQN